MRLRSPSLTLCWCGCNKESQPRGGRGRGGARSVLPRTRGSSARYSELSERKQPFSHQMLILLMWPFASSFSLSSLSLSLHPPPAILSHPFHSCFSHTVRWEYLSKAPTSQTSEGYPRCVTPSHLSGPCPSARLDAMKTQVLLQFLRASNG